MSWSKSRSRRFNEKKRANDVEFRSLPSTLSSRGTSIGYGRRIKLESPYGINSPSPGAYNLPSLCSRIGTKFSRQANGDLTKRFNTPGPGSYDPLLPLGKTTQKVSLKSRTKLIKRSESPSPCSYTPDYKLTHYTGFQNITFGVGERSMLRCHFFNGPGPGTYQITSVFDKKQITN